MTDRRATMAADLRAYYIAARRQSKPGYQQPSARYDDAFWLKLADDVLALPNPSALRYINLAFETFSSECMPNMLRATALKKKYTDRYCNYLDELNVRYKCMEQLMRQHILAGRHPMRVLDDSSLYFDNFFRFVASHRLGFTNLCAKYRGEAAIELRGEPLLRSVYPNEASGLHV